MVSLDNLSFLIKVKLLNKRMRLKYWMTHRFCRNISKQSQNKKYLPKFLKYLLNQHREMMTLLSSSNYTKKEKSFLNSKKLSKKKLNIKK